MANVERVVLNIEIDTDTRKLGSLTALLKAHEQRVNRVNRAYKNMGRDLDKVDRNIHQMDRRVGRLGRTFQTVGRTAFKFISVLTKFSFIAYAGQVAILTTALLGAKLAMASGRVAAQGYSVALRGVAAGATAAATAIAIAAASMRQFQEAQLSPFTGGVGGAAQRGRGLSTSMRGLLGAEASQQALKGLVQAGVGVSRQNAVLRELFNISGGDSKQVTSLIGSIQGEPGTFGKAVGASAGGAAAAARAGDLQGAALIQLLASGGLTSGTGFAGLDQVMGQTVIGTLKTELQVVLGALANAGEGLLGPTRDTIRLLSSTLTNFIGRVMPLIMQFGDMVLGSDGMASGLQKISNSLFRLMDHAVPRLEGFMDRMSGMARATRMFFRDMADRMRPLEAGAEVLMDMFGNMFGGMVGNGVLDRFNRTLTTNAESFREFGESIGNVFRAFFSGSGGGDSMVSVVDRMTDAFNQFATEVVPPLKEIANSIKDIVLNGLPPVLAAISAILSGLAPLFGLLGATSGIPGAGGLLLGGGLLAKSKFGRNARMARAGGMAVPGLLPAGMFSRMGAGLHGTAMQRLGLHTAKGAIVPSATRTGRFLAGTRGAALMGGTMAIGGGLLAGDALGEAYQGDGSALTLAKGAAAGAMIGSIVPGVGTAIGAAVGAGIGLVTTGIMAAFGERRQKDRLTKFMEETFANSTDTATQKLENFNYALENFEEIAERSGLDAEDFKAQLDELAPLFNELSDVIESKVRNRVKLLTEVYGLHADEADALARSLNDVDFSQFAGEMFDRTAADATGGFGFSRLFGVTSGNKSQLRSEQAALQSQLESEFGGDLDLAAQTEAGERLIEQLFNNIFAQSMLEPDQTGAGAEITALKNLENFFGPSSTLSQMGDAFETFLKEDSEINTLLGEGNLTLEEIAAKLDGAFGGGAETQMMEMLRGVAIEQMAAEGRAPNIAAADAFARQNIGLAMSNLFTTSNPINIEGIVTEQAVAQIRAIVLEEQSAAEAGIVRRITADLVGTTAFPVKVATSARREALNPETSTEPPPRPSN